MSQVKEGDAVKVHYTGKLEDGTVFDSSREREPLKVNVGAGELIPGFEKSLMGMEPGQSKTEKIPADQAYGPHMKELVVEVGKDQIPPDIETEIGTQLQIKQEDGQTTMVRITELNDETVTLDANHPLAGKDLTFEIELLETA